MSAEKIEVPELKPVSTVSSEVAGDAPKEKPEDPRASEKYTFDFSFEDARGKTWTGKFTNNALTVGNYRLYKLTKARLCQNVPLEALDPDAEYVNDMLAHLSVSLEKNSDFPSWAKDLDKLPDIRIIAELYKEVASHEATFQRRESDPVGGEVSGEDGPG